MKNNYQTNTYYKYCPNVYLAKCPERHEKGEKIVVTTKYGKEYECIVFNKIGQTTGFFYYSIVRADGFNVQEWARRKAESYAKWSENATKKSNAYFVESEKDKDFLSLGEPIKVGHHSEKRHRKAIEDQLNNTGKAVEFSDKAEYFADKSENWEKRTDVINLSMPESIEYFKNKLDSDTEYHEGLKSGKYPREHSFSLPYAKKAVNEAQKNYNLAVKLWGDGK